MDENRLVYTQRIGWAQYNTREKLNRLLRFLSTYRSLADEISFFTEGDGKDWRYVPAEEVERRAVSLTEAVAGARAAGFKPVINILNTLGHSDEGGADAPVLPWRGMVGLDGAQARQCSCPADEHFLDYIRFKYERYARCGADRYWIDDDVRIGNHSPVQWGCFCPGCLAEFSKRAGRDFSRTDLTEALRTDRTIRSAWYARNGEVILHLLKACAEGVTAENRGAEIGLMTCDVTGLLDAGVDFSKWFGELSRITGGRAWLRPGGGFWSDSTPREMLSKAHSVANTVSALPEGVRATYEVENYPFTIGSKSAAMTGLECLIMTLGTRLEGIMFDILDMAGNDPAPQRPWLDELAKWRPLWDRAAELVRGTLPVGWRPVYSPHHFEQQVEERPLMELLRIDYQRPCALQLAGLPITGFAEGEAGCLLSGSAANGMSVEELRALLDKPLLIDGDAAARFVAVGLGGRIGVRSVAIHREGVYESLNDHPLNGAATGYDRVVTLKYFGLHSHALELLPGTESLSTLRSYGGKELGSALSLYRPANAAPVAVLGHIPWSFVLSPQRMIQLRNLSAALLGEAISRGPETIQPVAWWHRRSADGRRHLEIFFNASFDGASLPMEGVAGKTLALATPGVGMTDAGLLKMPGWSVAVMAN